MYSNKIVCEILKYIDDNINTKISIDDLENKFFYNKFYILKLFKKEMNMTIIEYINSLRIYNSILQIKDTNNSLLSIAFKNGFYSIEYFSETFKKIVGINPQIVKKHFKNKNSISLEQSSTISDSLLNLYYIKQKRDKYLANKKPNISPVKELSIFKKTTC